jgi:signal transduction histidine kinase
VVLFSLWTAEASDTGIERRWRELMQVEHATMLALTLGALGLSVWARRAESAVGRRWLPPTIAQAYLLFGALDASLDQLVTSSITVFVIVAILFAFLLRLRPLTSAVQAAVALGAFVVLQGHFQPDPTLRLSNIGSAMGTSLASVLLSTGFSVLRQRDFAHRLTIRRQHAELEAAFASMRELAERAQAASRAKSTFLATISHEIRTPLNGVLGVNELLASTRLDAEQQQLVRTIGEAGRSLLAVINDVLDISKIEAGQLSMEAAPFDLREVVDTVGQLFAAGASEKGLRLETAWPEALPRLYLGDRARLRQVLSNLVANAVKFTALGGVRLTVERAGGDDQPQLLVRVVDTGIGLTAEQQGRLFQPFTQGDASTTRRFGGTGLGLAISKRLVEAMGGTIGVESAPGQGSTFWVRLSLPVAAEALAPTGAAPEGGSRFRGRALIAEDNPVNMLVARRMLARLGLEVLEAPDGQAALELLEHAKVDVVFTDLHMPELDGYGLARALRARGHTTPIIAVTANVMPADLAACLTAGMNESLSKPFSLADLERVLERWLPSSVRAA